MRRAILTGLAGLSLLTACGSSQPPASPAISAAPFTGDPFPSADTAIGAAPQGLADLWRPYGVTVIPGHQAIDEAAVLAARVQVVNHSSGMFTQQQVQALATALLRGQLLDAWASANVQPALTAHLVGQLFEIGPDSVALADGDAVHYPLCATVPVAMTIFAPSASFDALLTARNASTLPGDFPVALSFSACGPTTAVTPSGQQLTLESHQASRVVVAAVARDDRVLGAFLFIATGVPCSAAGVQGWCAS